MHNRIRVDRVASSDSDPEGRVAQLPPGVDGLFADTTPLRTPDFRRLWLSRHRHGHRGESDDLRRTRAAVRVDAELGVRRACPDSSRWCHWWCSVCGAARGPTPWTADCCSSSRPAGWPLSSVLLWLQAALALNNVWVVLCLLVRTAGLLRDQLADPLGGHSADAARRAAARGQLVEHDRDAVRCDRRPVARRADVALGGPVHAVPHRCDHVRRPDLGDVPARPDATDGAIGLGVRRQQVGLWRGVRRVSLPVRQPGGADVLRRRPDRDDPRHAAGAVPADGPPELRRTGRGRHHHGAAGRGDVGGRRGGRVVLRLAAADSTPGTGRRGVDRGVGCRDGRDSGWPAVWRTVTPGPCCGLR